MHNFVTLNLKCPVCGESLMDHNKLVDNEHSVRLIIETPTNKGIIQLSSVYGSYNYISDINIPKDEIAEFYCPHCKSQITNKEDCETCGAPMVTFNIEMGGQVSICSRSGCKNHLMKFSDISVALKRLYQEYGYQGKSSEDNDLRIKKEVKPKHDEDKEIIETGAFLQSYCPHCHKSLIENNMLKLKIKSDKSETGYLLLSPYLNVFTSKSTIFLPEDKVVNDLICPHCNESLIIADKKCEKCGSPVAKILISARTKFIDFYICTKKGCRWHGLKDEDYEDIVLEDSEEW